MARGGFPSMTALLGLLAVAGSQNRDKLTELLRNRGGGGGGAQGGTSLPGGLDGLLGGLGVAARTGDDPWRRTWRTHRSLSAERPTRCSGLVGEYWSQQERIAKGA